MRNLFLALVLANLGFAAWQSWYSEDAQTVISPEREFGDIMLAAEFTEANPGLAISRIPATGREGAPDASTAFRTDPAILAESAADTQRATTEETGDETEEGAEGVAVTGPRPGSPPEFETAQPLAAADGDPGRVCMSVGPFSELAQVTTAAANLREDGLMPRQRAGEGNVWAGYWVYIDGVESMDAAQTMLEPLHEAGLPEAYASPDSDDGISITIGIFSEIVGASRARERVRDLGFEATIADRVRRGTVYWIDVDLPAGDTLDFERLQPPGRIVRLEQRPCREVVL